MSQAEDLESLFREADDWYVRLGTNSLTTSDKIEYLNWLKRSPEHVAKILKLQRYGNRAGPLRNVVAAVDSVAPSTERDGLTAGWAIVAKADDRDLVLWAEDSVPVAPRIEEAFGQSVASVPESSLKLMAVTERQRRSKRTERIWWILGIIATFIASPLLVSAAKMLTGTGN